MKVMHADGGNLYGGVETILTALARYRNMCPAMRTEFALCHDGRLRSELEGLGAAVHLIGSARMRNPWSVRAARHRMRELLSARGAEVLVCHGPWAQALFAPAARAAGIPLVFWIHAPLRRGLWLDQWSRWSSPDLAVFASKFVGTASAGFFADNVAQTYFYPPLIEDAVLPSPAQRAAVRADLETSTESVVIVQASRMESWKGQGILLQALSGLTDLPDWRCWIAGGAQRPDEIAYERELRGYVTEHGLESRVSFLGERTDVPVLLGCADIYCQANVCPEPFGIVFLEAMNVGLPVVASASGGALEIVADSGILVTPGNASELGEELRRLIGDRDLRRRLGQSGPARALELCGARSRMELLERLLADVTQGPRACRASVE